MFYLVFEFNAEILSIKVWFDLFQAKLFTLIISCRYYLHYQPNCFSKL